MKKKVKIRFLYTIDPIRSYTIDTIYNKEKMCFSPLQKGPQKASFMIDERDR